MKSVSSDSESASGPNEIHEPDSEDEIGVECESTLIGQ